MTDFKQILNGVVDDDIEELFGDTSKTMAKMVQQGIRSNKIINDSGFSRAISNGVGSSVELVCKGAGQTINQAGGKLIVTAGTTANEETIIRTREPIKGEALVNIMMQRSQAIANNRCLLHLTDVIGNGLSVIVNSATSATITIPNTNKYYNRFIKFCTCFDGSIDLSQMVGMSMTIGGLVAGGVIGAIPSRYPIASATYNENGVYLTFTVSGWTSGSTGTCTLFAWNFIGLYMSGTSAYSVNIDCARFGYSSSLGYVASGSSTLLNTSNIMYSLSKKDANVEFYANLLTSNAVQSLLGGRAESMPDAEEELYLQWIVRNETVAPATNTTFNFLGYRCLDISSSPVTLTDNQQVGVAKPIPISGSVSATMTSTSITGVTPSATVGGTTLQSLVISAASTNSTLIKNAAGTLIGGVLTNTGASPAYFKLYNKATAPTVGTDAQFKIITLPANSVVPLANIFSAFGDRGNSTGIGYGITGGYATSDTTAVAAGQVTGYITYI